MKQRVFAFEKYKETGIRPENPNDMTNWLSQEYFVNYICKNNILEFLYTTYVHSESIKWSFDILKLITESGKL